MSKKTTSLTLATLLILGIATFLITNRPKIDKVDTVAAYDLITMIQDQTLSELAHPLKKAHNISDSDQEAMNLYLVYEKGPLSLEQAKKLIVHTTDRYLYNLNNNSQLQNLLTNKELPRKLPISIIDLIVEIQTTGEPPHQHKHDASLDVQYITAKHGVVEYTLSSSPNPSHLHKIRYGALKDELRSST